MIDPATEKLVSLSKAARQLGCTWQSVRDMISAGLLEGIQVPGLNKKTKIKTSLEAVARCCQPVSPAHRLTTPKTPSRTRSTLQKRKIL